MAITRLSSGQYYNDQTGEYTWSDPTPVAEQIAATGSSQPAKDMSNIYWGQGYETDMYNRPTDTLNHDTAWFNPDGTVSYYTTGGGVQVMSREQADKLLAQRTANEEADSKGFGGFLSGLGEIAGQLGKGYGLYMGGSQLANMLGSTAASDVAAMSLAEGMPAAEAGSMFGPSVNAGFGTTAAPIISPEVAAAASGLGAAGTAAAAGGGLLANSGLPTSNGFIQGLTPDVAVGAGGTTLGGAGAAATGAAASGGMLADLAATLGVSESTLATLGSGALNTLGGLLASNAAGNTAETQANAQLEAARIAADAAKFRPIGVTTRFGSSNFQKDAAGNVIGAGYNLSPDVKAQQDRLMAMSGGLLGQYEGAQAATAPMGDAAQRAMQLGQGYLATDPAAQAQKYMQEQQALLATGRERAMSGALQGEYNRGTYGLATGGTSTGMMAANPRLEALYNAQRQQDLGLAAQATQGGMDYAKFGAGMVGTGGDLLKQMYGTQTAAYQPYQTAFGGAQTLEGLGQNALETGMNLGRQTSNAQSGALLSQGMLAAANTQAGAASSPWAQLLMGAGNTLGQMAQPAKQQAYAFDPYTGKPVVWGQG